ncbi:gamma carbonic anhydrase family protein [Plesiomonas shigelloides]|uniref:gamma carbonic anhydrase family protein n=1 Tax=Plesiomonas shigelloides TaxID=703 RepID=UPI001262A773|nr:gamma carbonic anhydrase family protein [Plesiomonas shigelloides]KAB7660251.1 gamma carbonic anhydrase family protein [Plesiomonas shigelloides]KAB7692761.1 gamma carbonic anhydrase family protein [Plesiomonas shigelloides]
MTVLRPYKGKTPEIGLRVMLDESCVIIGHVTLGDDVSIWPSVVIRGDVNYITVGNRTNIQDGSVLHVTRKTSDNPAGLPLYLGDDVTIGHKAVLHGCTVGNRVLIGMGAIILDGAVIEDEVIIGAGGLVPPHKHLESGYLYLGNPVRQARLLTAEERASLQQSADNYLHLKNEYLAEQAQ